MYISLHTKVCNTIALVSILIGNVNAQEVMDNLSTAPPLEFTTSDTGQVLSMLDGSSSNSSLKALFIPVATEEILEDHGTANLTNGVADIAIDPILFNYIHADKKHSFKVFIQPEGESNGIYVTGKTATGFQVKELQNGDSNAAFSWHIVTNRKGKGEKIDFKPFNYSD